MKAIMLSINPKWVAKILNGEKTIEIRKKFPKDYVGWVYIYCTKEKDKHEICIYDNPIEHRIMCSRYHFLDNGEEARIALFNPRYIKGKVVARFWCDKVEKVHCNSYGLETSEHWYRTTDKNEKELLNECALTFEELDDYLCFGNGCAIHISQLEIFNKPKEISEFYKLGAWKVYEEQLDSSYMKRTEQEIMKSLGQTLTRAPESYCYIEID